MNSSSMQVFFFFFKFDPIAAFREPYINVLKPYGSILNGTRVPCNFFFNFILLLLLFFKFDRPILDFLQIKFQNRCISPISLGNGVKRWFFCTKRAFAHFGPYYWLFFSLCKLLQSFCIIIKKRKILNIF